MRKDNYINNIKVTITYPWTNYIPAIILKMILNIIVGVLMTFYILANKDVVSTIVFRLLLGYLWFMIGSLFILDIRHLFLMQSGKEGE